MGQALTKIGFNCFDDLMVQVYSLKHCKFSRIAEWRTQVLVSICLQSSGRRRIKTAAAETVAWRKLETGLEWGLSDTFSCPSCKLPNVESEETTMHFSCHEATGPCILCQFILSEDLQPSRHVLRSQQSMAGCKNALQSATAIQLCPHTSGSSFWKHCVQELHWHVVVVPCLKPVLLQVEKRSLAFFLVTVQLSHKCSMSFCRSQSLH